MPRSQTRIFSISAEQGFAHLERVNSSELSHRMRGETKSSPQAAFSVWLIYHDPYIFFMGSFGIQRHLLESLLFTKPIGDASEGRGTSSRRLNSFWI